jgi:mannosyltransferase OCH1-like enzyme
LIPKIIHQTWRTSKLPKNFSRWSAEWRRLHPTWDYRFYDDNEVETIVKERAPELYEAFRSLARQIQRIDMFRYLIVYLDGGLYADIDMIPFRPSDRLIEGESCVIGVEHRLMPWRQAELEYKHPYQIQNCIFAAEPGHPFFRLLLERISKHARSPALDDSDVEDITGPRMLTRIAFDLPSDQQGRIRVVPKIVWSAPREYPRIWPFGHQVHARHAATGTWRTQRRSFLRRLATWTPWPNPFERSRSLP